MKFNFFEYMKISFNRIFFMPLKPYSKLYFVAENIFFLFCIDYNDAQSLWTKAEEAIVKNYSALRC